MTKEYNKVVDKINRESGDVIITANGLRINKFDFYKSHFASWQRIQNAGSALLTGLEGYQEWLNEITPSIVISLLTGKIPGKMMFHVEVFFMMLCSSYEMLAWELDYLFPTLFEAKEINFTKVVNYLTGKKRKIVSPFLKTLRKYNDTWVQDIRDYIIHRGHLQIRTHVGKRIIPTMLPDNPKHSKLKYSRKRDLFQYCKGSLAKSMELFTNFYQFVDSHLA